MPERTLDPQVVSVLAHRQLPVQAPVDAGEVLDLVRRLALPPTATVVDVGCGMGGWIGRILERYPDARIRGIDTSEPALAVARRRYAEAIEAGRLTLELADARDVAVDDPVDLVVCVGAQHACGNTVGTLRRLRSWVKPTGRVLLGATYWTHPPSEEVRAIVGDPSVAPSLEGLRTMLHAVRLRVEFEQVSSLSAWDRYEAGWVAGIDRAARAVEDPLTGVQLLSVAEVHERAYHEGYRGQLGFAVLTLAPS